jgi:hypothetical protein
LSIEPGPEDDTSGTISPVDEADVSQEEPFSLEEALAAHEEAVRSAAKAVDNLRKAMKSWEKAAAAGHMANRRKAAETAARLSSGIQSALDAAQGSWRFDVSSYLQGGGWRQEVVEAARSRYGLRVLDEQAIAQLISSPVTVQAIPAREALRISKQLWPAIRPSVVATELKRLRDRLSAAGVQELAERLYDACRREARDGRMYIAFRTAYDLFSLAPDWKRENSPTVFAQALHALHISDVKTTRSGKVLQWEWPSGKPKPADVFSVRAEDGREMRYFGLWFR